MKRGLAYHFLIKDASLKRDMLRGALGRSVGPIGSVRALSRVVKLVRETNLQSGRIPKGATQRERSLRAKEWGRTLLNVLGVEVTISGELPELDGPVMVMANHRSYVDILVLLSLLPVRFLAKQEVEEWPVIGRVATMVNTIYVKREAKESRGEVRRVMREALGEGGNVAVFPEGTTVAPPGCGAFYRGSFEVAVEANVPILPVAIEYLREDIWLNESAVKHYFRTFSKRKVPVWVMIGPLMVEKLEEGVGEVEDTMTRERQIAAADRLMERTRTWHVDILEGRMSELKERYHE